MSTAQSDSDASWKTRVIVIGTLIGAVTGLGTAYLLIRTAEEKRGGRPHISTGDALKAALGLVGVVRGIAALGDR